MDPRRLDDALAEVGAQSEGLRADWAKADVAARLFGEPEPAAPRRIGRFTVVGLIGRGGMGEVFAARDEELDRTVAIKVMARQATEIANERFLREGRALAKLSHAHIVQVHEVGQHDGAMFIAMEHVIGRTLASWLRESRRPWTEVVPVLLDAGRGLAAAHAAGLVHRDFKPENVMVGDDGRVRVLDFGLARSAESRERESMTTADTASAAEREQRPASQFSSERRVTETGTLLGTPAYMAPEQHRGEAATPAADQFSFAVAAWEALYGNRPFVGQRGSELLAAIEAARLVSVPSADVPGRVRKIIARGLAAEPADRWPSLDAMLTALAATIRPRNRRAIGLGALLMVSVVGLAVLQSSASPAMCTGAPERLAGIWDETRRDQVRSAILASGDEWSAHSWARIEPQLDDYSEAWVAAHTSACEATRVEGVQSEHVMDLRVACLEGRRTELKSVVDILSSGDGQAVPRAIELVAQLPPIEGCADIEALGAEIPPPEDPKVRAEVDAVRDLLAHARARLAAGAVAAADDEAEQANVRARRIDYPPVWAEALLVRGTTLDANGEYTEAKDAFEQAYVMASEHEHLAVAADSAQWLVWVLGHRLAQFDAGIHWGTTALALAKRPTSTREDEARVLRSLAALEAGRGDVGAAHDHYQRALWLREMQHGPNDLRVAESLVDLGHGLHGIQRQFRGRVFQRPASNHSVGDRFEAMERNRDVSAVGHMRRALAIREAALGLEHPGLVAGLTALGGVLADLGDADQALAAFERALAIADATFGPEHPARCDILLGMGSIAFEREDFDLAREHIDHALATAEAAYEPDNPAIATPLFEACVVHARVGRIELARPACDRAVAIRSAALGPDHLDLGYAEVLLGSVLRRQGELAPARAQLERGYDNIKTHLGLSDVATVFPLEELAELALSEGAADLASEYAQQAIDVDQRQTERPHASGRARFILAKALWELGRTDQSIAAASTARAELARDDGTAVSEVDAWLAERSG